ncbi:MAG: hypothetical protein SPI30_02595, partial [Prevotella sp.]|nr:hypothetical protein [Prevotella sp.]
RAVVCQTDTETSGLSVIRPFRFPFPVKPKSVIRPPTLHYSPKMMLTDRLRSIAGIFSAVFTHRNSLCFPQNDNPPAQHPNKVSTISDDQSEVVSTVFRLVEQPDRHVPHPP